MSDPIGPGDYVECAPPAGYRGQVTRDVIKVIGEYPKRGGIYQVREVGFLTGANIPGLRLVGIVASYPGHPDAWWTASCFRPVYRPKSSLIQRLLHPTPADLGEVV